MIYYSKEDILDLVQYLDSHGIKYEALSSILKMHTEANFNDPLLEGLFGDLQQFFPDVVWALNLPEEDLPAYIDLDVGLEAPIARWRLKKTGFKDILEIL